MDWIPVPNRMDGEGYTALVDHANGAAHLGAWLAMLEIASRRDPRGTLPQEGAEIPRALARISRLPASVFEEALPRLLQIGWIEQYGESPQEGAEIPQGDAAECLRARVTEGKGMEVKNMCASDDARVSVLPLGSLPSIDSPPFETTEPGALFPVEPRVTPRAKPFAQGMTTQQEGWFASWWSEYFRRTAKKAAREAFRKQVKTEARFQHVMAATRAQRPEMLSREEGKRPHGASWINGERWEDETAPSVAATPSDDYPEFPQ
jgi:hypothetical protein